MSKPAKSQGIPTILLVVLAVAGVLIITGVVLVIQNVVTKKSPVSTSPSITNPLETIVSTKELCTTVEKVCITYPKEWKAEMTSENSEVSEVTMETVKVMRDGDKMLNFTTGASGLGGSCAPNPEDIVTLQFKKVYKTGIKTNTNKTLYVISYVEKSANGYVNGVMYTGEPNNYKVGKMTSVQFCDVHAPGLFGGRPRSDGKSPGMFILGYGTYPPKTYSTLDDALADKDAERAVEALASIHYK